MGPKCWRRFISTMLCVSVLAVTVAVGRMQPTPAMAAPTDAEEVPLLDSEAPEREESPPVAPAPVWPEPGTAPALEPDSWPEPVEELVDRRDAFTRVFRNADGSLTVDVYAEPIHYMTEDGWQPIDTTISADEDRRGWIEVDGNEFTTTFGHADEGLALGIAEGTVGIAPIGAGAAGATSSTPPDDAAPDVVEDGESATSQPESADELVSEDAAPEPGVVEYSEVWPGVDLRYEVGAAGVKEEIVLHDASAGHRFSFELVGTELALRSDGSVGLVGPLGDDFEIPPPTAVTSDGRDETRRSGVHYELAAGTTPGSTVLTVAVEASWLESLADSRFPVRLDPSFTLVNATSGVSYKNTAPTTAVFGLPIAMGRNSTNGVIWRSGVHFSQYEPYLTGGYRVYNAMLQFLGQTSTEPAISVYDQGAQPLSYSAIGNAKPLVTGQWDGAYLTVTQEMDRWVTNGLPDQWFGVRGVETGNTIRTRDVRLVLSLYQPPQASWVANISDQQVLATATPELVSQPVPFGSNGADPGTHPWAEFQITTAPAPGTGMVLSSGMIEQTTETAGVRWQVPTGTLQEGLTYWAWVITDFPQYGSNVPPTVPPASYGRRFTVGLGLGNGGPSPIDEIGTEVHGRTTPALSAPSPGVPASKLTVNLVDGNLALTVGTRTMRTLSGPLALAFTYNSLAAVDRGLRGEFYNDTNGSGAIDDGDTMVADRTDPTVSFDWGTGSSAKAVAGHDPTKALARWSGFLNVPSTGTWQIGAISSDGLRATVGGTMRLDQWATHEPPAAGEFGSSFSASAGTPLPITIEWRNTSGRGVARVFLKNVTNAASPVTYSLSPTWLSRTAPTLPHGWTMNAAAGVARWVGLQDRGTSVAVFDVGGTAHEFIATPSGTYTPPVSAPHELLTAANEGKFVLRDAAGAVYTFRADGGLESLVGGADDRNPSALEYGHSGTPARLRTITDPLSDRDVVLSYGGDAECAGSPAPPAGLLCKVAFWDGTATTLSYDWAGRLVRITNPGGLVHDFSYWSNGTLASVRDPLANDAIAAGVRTDLAATDINYTVTDKRVSSITQPAPIPGALRPGRTYQYDTVNRSTTVHVLGFTPTTGFAERVRYDTRNRITERTGSDGLSTTYAWDALDRPFSVTEATGLRTTTTYDHASRPVTTYGPAPASSFGANGLPVAGASVPATTRAYDEGINGLGATYWDNPYLAGGPALHDTGLGAGGAMDRDWGSTPPVEAGPDGWSARYTGYLNVPAGGAHSFELRTRGSKAKVWLDDSLVVDHSQPEPDTGWATTAGPVVAASSGLHRLRVDMVDTGGPSGLQLLWWAPTGTAFTVIPGANLLPDYGLLTKVTDPDGKVLATAYADSAAGIGPHHGLPTATVVDPAGLALSTKVSYESPGAASFLRAIGRTLPAGNTTVTSYYGGTEGPIDAVCDVAPGTPQGGLTRRVTSPDPDGAGPGQAQVSEFVHDAVGRTAGHRAGTKATIDGAGWECTRYDSRGRLSSNTWPSHEGAPGRTVTYSYAVAGNPLVVQVVDSALPGKAITATFDILNRPTAYTDAANNTTTTTYDRVGRVTTTAGAWTLTQNYDAANGRSTTLVANGVTIGTPTYDAYGRISSATYGNGSASTHSYDAFGRAAGVAFWDSTGVTGHVVTRSLAGRVVDEQVFVGTGFVDAVPTGTNYAYDGAGRLTKAVLPAASFDYSYAAAPSCPAPAAGANTNRSVVTVTGTGAGSTSSCYNLADQLASTSSISAGQIEYDDHGNTVRLGSETFDYDAADRHVRTENATAVTTYRRDPVDRLLERTDRTRVVHAATTNATTAGANVSATRPAGTATGDLIVAAVTATTTSGSPGALTAAGWTVAADRTNGGVRTWVVWRYATATDPTAWTLTASAAAHTTAAVSTYRSTGATAPVAAAVTSSANGSTTHAAPAVIMADDAHHLIHVTGLAGTVTATAPSGTTTRASVAAPASLVVSDRYQSRPGTTTAADTTSDSAADSASVTVAIAPLTATGVFGYAGHSMTSNITRNAAGTIIEGAIGLPGSTAYVYGVPGGWRYVHSNMHGDVVTVTSLATARLWTGYSGPYGELAAGGDPATTGQPGTTLRWHGSERLTDRGIVHLGARPYSIAHGRFLSVDPVTGGCANAYTYVYGDPVNSSDLLGTNWLGDLWEDVSSTALDIWDATLGKVFNCDEGGLLSFIEEFGLIPNLDSGGGDSKGGGSGGKDNRDVFKEDAAEYLAVTANSVAWTGLDIMIKTGQIKASAATAAWVAGFAGVGQALFYAGTASQIIRHFAC